jgi:FkbM family methyltransferase
MLIRFTALSRSSWFGKALRLPLLMMPRDLPVPVLRGPMKGRKWIVGSSVHKCWLGCYEVAESLLLQQTIAPGSTFFDIGSQAGYYALLGAGLVGPRGRVFAFEPHPRNIDYLRRHVKLNHLTNITIVQVAVADREGTCSFASGINPESGHLSSAGDLTVKTVSLDDELSRGSIPVPDAIKIDVEGAELKVLQGARKLLVEKHPTIYLETHPWIREFAPLHNQCCEYLKALGYQLKPITGRGLDDTCHIFGTAA